jgi:hypothetical protein
LQKSVPVIGKAVFINLFDILPKNIVVKPSIRPDIRYPALTGFPAAYPVSGFLISRMSGRPDIRQKHYPVHPYNLLYI